MKPVLRYTIMFTIAALAILAWSGLVVMCNRSSLPLDINTPISNDASPEKSL